MFKWPTKEMKEVAILNPKRSEIKDRSDNLSVSFVPMSAVNEYTQSIAEFETRALNSVRKGYTYFLNGDVLFAKITPCMENGKVAIAHDLENGIGFGSTEFHVLRPSEQVTSEWIFHIVASSAFREEAEEHMQGAAGQRRVPLSFLENYKIPVPPIEEQRKIVARIEKTFAKIGEVARLRAESEAATAALLPAALHEIFSGSESKGLNEVEVGSILSDLRTGPFGSTLHKSDYVLSGVPVVNPQNIERGKIIPLERTMVSAETRDRLKQFSLVVGDIVMARRGEMGRCAVVTEREEGWLCGTGSAILRFQKSVASEYVVMLLGSGKVREFLEGASVGTTMSNLNQDILRKIKIPLPSLAVQRKIVKKLDALSEKVRALQELQSQQAADLKALKQSILHEAFAR